MVWEHRETGECVPRVPLPNEIDALRKKKRANKTPTKKPPLGIDLSLAETRQLDVKEDRYEVLMFVNGSSGSAVGSKLFAMKATRMDWRDPWVTMRVFNMADPWDRARGIDVIAKLFRKQRKMVVVAVGGDGTVKWIIEEIAQLQSSSESKGMARLTPMTASPRVRSERALASKYNVNIGVPLSIIPCGSGNDLSRVLGWGIIPPNPFVGHHCEAIRGIAIEHALNVANHNFVIMDVWEVRIKTQSGGYFCVVKDRVETRMQSANIEPLTGGNAFELAEKMCNYFSFGSDAEVVFNFEKNRTNTRGGNKMVYIAEGAKLLVKGNLLMTEALAYVHARVTKPDGSAGIEPVQLTDQLATALIFLNIASYAAGCDLWDPKIRHPRAAALKKTHSADLDSLADKTPEHTPLHRRSSSMPVYRQPATVDCDVHCNFTEQRMDDNRLEMLSMGSPFAIAKYKTQSNRDGFAQEAQARAYHIHFKDISAIHMQIDGEAIKVYRPLSIEIQRKLQKTMVQRRSQE